MEYVAPPSPGYIAETGDKLLIPDPLRAGLDTVDSIGRDLDPAGAFGVLIGGIQNLQNALIRRLRCPRGYLPHHPEYGSRLPEFLGQELDLGTVMDIRDDVSDTLLQDPRVLTILELAVDPSLDSVVVSAIVETPLGPVAVDDTVKMEA